MKEEYEEPEPDYVSFAFVYYSFENFSIKISFLCISELISGWLFCFKNSKKNAVVLQKYL